MLCDEGIELAAALGGWVRTALTSADNALARRADRERQKGRGRLFSLAGRWLSTDTGFEGDEADFQRMGAVLLALNGSQHVIHRSPKETAKYS